MCMNILPIRYLFETVEERTNKIIEFAKLKLGLNLSDYKEEMLLSFDSDLEFTYLGPGKFETTLHDNMVYNCILKTSNLVYFILSDNTFYDHRKNNVS